MKRIIIAEDERIVSEDIKMYLQDYGYEVASVAETGREAVKNARDQKPDLVLIDIVLRGRMDGIEAARRIREDLGIPVVYLTAYADQGKLERAKVTEPFGYILKPFEERELYSTIEMALYKSRMEKKMSHLRGVLEATRRVDQFIARETDRGALIKGVCDRLVDTRGYYNAWILLFDESGRLFEASAAGTKGRLFSSMAAQAKKGEMSPCIRKALRTTDTVLTEDPKSLCGDCPLAIEGSCKGTMTVRLKHGEKDYGVFSASIPAEFIREPEEKELFSEVAVDIAHALYTIELDDERKRFKESLRESEERFRSLVEESPLGVSLISKKGVYKYLNPRFTEIFGYTLEDIPNGKEWFRKAYPERNYRHKAISTWINDEKNFETGESRARTFRVLCKQGSEKIINFRPVTLKSGDRLLIYEDITERRHLEAQVFHAQRMEAVGTLAGGIAHNFNNLLTAILNNITLMLLDKDPDHPEYERLKNMEKRVLESSELTGQLLGIGRGGKRRTEPQYINKIIKEQNRIFGMTRKEVTLRGEYEKRPWTVKVDKSQVQQVILNLYVNAWQAMPGGGNIYLKTKNIVLDEDHASAFNAESGRYVMVSVSDTGTGMNEDILKRIFDPFFTTKEEGTGLGLASVYGIIRNHGGFVEVSSEEGKGSTFNLYFPAFEGDAKQEDENKVEELSPAGTILLVDDEESITGLGKILLSRIGYRVFTAREGSEALEIYRKNMGEIDIVILDLVMPGMGGMETFQRLKQLDPGVKVLVSTGHTSDSQIRDMLAQGCQGLIQKPFNMKIDLPRKIKEVMDKG